MDKSQFHIPSTSFEPEPEQPGSLFDALDTKQYTPETQPSAFERIKQIEDRIHAYRETALTPGATPKSSSWLGSATLFRLRGKSATLDQLIEAESHIGGSLFGEGHQFWLNKKGDHPLEEGWYHCGPMVTSPKDRPVLHYQFSVESAQKYHNNGQPLPFTEGEIERLEQVAQLYEEKILPQLYPIDAVIRESQLDENNHNQLAA